LFYCFHLFVYDMFNDFLFFFCGVGGGVGCNIHMV